MAPSSYTWHQSEDSLHSATSCSTLQIRSNCKARAYLIHFRYLRGQQGYRYPKEPKRTLTWGCWLPNFTLQASSHASFFSTPSFFFSPSLHSSSLYISAFLLLKMCYQLVEWYKACRCLYYSHAVDRCPSYGREGHEITQGNIFVGYACRGHSLGYTGPPIPTNFPRAPRDASNPKSLTIDEFLTLTTTCAKVAEEERKKKSTSTQRLPSSDDLNSRPPPSEDIAPLQQDHNLTCTEFNADWRSADGYQHINETDDPESDLGSEFSDTETVVSVASSLTLVDSDAVEIVFRRLMLFGNLRYLWPQLIARCENRQKCLQTIERLLRRYAEDLGQLAQHTLDKTEAPILFSAGRFIRK